MAYQRQKPPKVRLIDDTGFMLQRVVPHVPKEVEQFVSEIHRGWIRTLPCVLCGKLGCQACHLRMGTQTGMKQTPHDFWLWPGEDYCHLGLQHRTLGEKTFWHVRLGILDPHRFILETYALKSPCPKTVTLAREEYTVRYGEAA